MSKQLFWTVGGGSDAENCSPTPKKLKRDPPADQYAHGLADVTNNRIAYMR